jgi:phosphoglycolate phosphatase-like HAD superfamily hydrolase
LGWILHQLREDHDMDTLQHAKTREFSTKDNGVLVRVHSQLELLKYVPIREWDLENDTSTDFYAGHGPELRIVTLPDLLVDFRAYNIRHRNERIDQQATLSTHATTSLEHELDEFSVCTVGGRAARTACALQHLLTDEDGTFRVNLLAKTGNLGRLLLQNEFLGNAKETGDGHRTCDTGSQRTFDSVFLPFVLPRSGEPRCALMGMEFDSGDGDGSPKLPISVLPNPQGELSEADMSSPNIRQLLLQATCIFISSIRSPTVTKTKVVPQILEMARRRGIAVFVDVERSATLTDVDKFITTLSGSAAPQHSIAGVFLSTDIFRASTLSLGQALQSMQGRWRAPLILYGAHPELDDPQKSSVCWIDETFTARVAYDSPQDHAGPHDLMVRENAAERFKAGVLLSFGLHQLLHHCVPKESRPAHNCARMLAEWPQDDVDVCSDVLSYGLFMASIRKRNSRFDPITDYYQQFGGEGSLLGDVGQPILVTTEETGAPLAKHWDLALPDGVRRRAMQLAALRRSNRLNNPELPVCRTKRESCSICKKRGNAKGLPTAAVMFDLDGTLLNSTAERNRAFTAALTAIAEEPKFLALECIRMAEPPVAKLPEYFSKYVYEAHAFYQSLEYGDFRQEWNHTGWYGALFALLNKAKLRMPMERFLETFIGLFNELQAARLSDQERTERYRELIDKNHDLVADFQDEFDEVNVDLRDIIGRARAAFEDVRMVAFKETRDILVSLKQSNAFSLFVVSEGDPKAQWHKIKSMGLDDIFDRSHVLTTGDAANTDTHQFRLQKERRRISETLEQFEGEEREAISRQEELDSLRREVRLLPGHGGSADLRRVIATIDRQSEGLAQRIGALRAEIKRWRERKATAECVKNVLEEMSFKAGYAFYAAVVRAILHDSKTPVAVLASVDKLIAGPPKDSSMKFAMVGDRRDNDIAWPLKLLGREQLITINLLSGKYSSATRPEHSGGEDPMFTVPTLACAKTILLSPDVWNTISCVSAPPFFNKDVEFDRREAETPDCQPERREHVRGRVQLKDVIDGVMTDPAVYPVINSVCLGILVEFLQARPSGRKANASDCLQWLLGSELRSSDDRTLLFARLINGGLFSGVSTSELRQGQADRVIGAIRQSPRNEGQRLELDRALKWCEDFLPDHNLQQLAKRRRKRLWEQA